jgi:hypothetical protein
MKNKFISYFLGSVLVFTSSVLCAKTAEPSSTEELLKKLKPFAVTNIGIDKLSPGMLSYHRYLQKMTSQLETCLAASKCGDGVVDSSADLDEAVDNLIDSIKTFNKTTSSKFQRNRNISDKTLTANASDLDEQLKKALPNAGDALPPVPGMLQSSRAQASKTGEEVLKHNNKAVSSQIEAALKAIEKDKSPEANARRILLKNMQADVKTLSKTIQAGNEGRASSLLQQMEKTLAVINKRPLGADMSDIDSITAGFKDYANKLTSSAGKDSVAMVAELKSLTNANLKLTDTAPPKGAQSRPHVVNTTAHTLNVPGLDPKEFGKGDDPQGPTTGGSHGGIVATDEHLHPTRTLPPEENRFLDIERQLPSER